MYQQRIREVLAQLGMIGQHDIRHIEAYMRVAHSTLDGLSPSQFRREVNLCAQCVVEGGVSAAERIAQSFGL